MNIGFIGLGNMGSGMASNLLNYCKAQGDSLYVLDINRETLDRFSQLGAIACQSVAELAQSVELVFTSLPSSREVNLVAYGKTDKPGEADHKGEQGLLQSLPYGAVWFETSTNELSEWEKVRAAAPEHLKLVDAPVTGGAEGAAAGTLTMLLGIDSDLLDQYQDILSAFTRRAVRLGPAGSGYVTKLCQLHLNYLVAQGIGEALMLGAKTDLDLESLHSVLKTSCAQSYVVDQYIPMVLDGSYDPSFTLALATKDMRLISELGQHLDVELNLGDQVYKRYQQACEQYGGDAPHLSLIRLLEDQSGQMLRSRNIDSNK